jgi:hypothetical protein
VQVIITKYTHIWPIKETGTVQSRIFGISVLSMIGYEMNSISNNDHVINIPDKVAAVLVTS